MDLGKLYTVFQDNQNTLKLFSFALLCTLVLSGHTQTLLINTIIFGYLSYKTMKFLSSCNENTQENTHQMVTFLKYWTGFSLLCVFEYLLSCLFSYIFMNVFYNALKLVYFVLLLQNNEILLMVYGMFFVPLFSNCELHLEQFFTMLELKAQEFKQSPGNENVNYSLYKYVEPYHNKFLKFIGRSPTNKLKITPVIATKKDE